MTIDTEGNVQIAESWPRICQTWNIYLNVPTMRRPVWQMEAKLIYDNNNNDLMTRTEYKIVPGPSPISSGKQWKRQKQKELLIVDRNSGLGIWKLFLIFSDDGQRPASLQLFDRDNFANLDETCLCQDVKRRQWKIFLRKGP